MDRLAQTALSAIRQMQDLKFDLAHNLANVNVPGFRRDLPNEGNAGFLKRLDEASAKVLPLETDFRMFSSEMGSLQNTGVETDVAVLNDAYFYVQPDNGQVALSRRGDFSVDALNQLINGAGDLVLSDGLAPIVLRKGVYFCPQAIEVGNLCPGLVPKGYKNLIHYAQSTCSSSTLKQEDVSDSCLSFVRLQTAAPVSW